MSKFLVYNTLVSGMYNSQLTKIINGEDQILKHFIGKCGSGETKYKIMSDYLSNITILKRMCENNRYDRYDH